MEFKLDEIKIDKIKFCNPKVYKISERNNLVLGKIQFRNVKTAYQICVLECDLVQNIFMDFVGLLPQGCPI